MESKTIKMKSHQDWKPFFSVVIILCFLFIFAFIQIENRRIGYSFLSLLKQEKSLKTKQRAKVAKLAKMRGADRIQYIATQKLPMRQAEHSQIIQMTSSGRAVVQ